MKTGTYRGQLQLIDGNDQVVETIIWSNQVLARLEAIPKDIELDAKRR